MTEVIANYGGQAMGASGWNYVTPFRGSIEATLEALHDDVFQEFYGDGEEYANREELYADEEFMGEEGTHSVLDVRRVVKTTEQPNPNNMHDYSTLRPLAPERLLHHFDTEQPTVQQYEDAIARAYEALSTRPFTEQDTTLLGEDRMRWTGVYILLYTDGEPTHVGIFGSSGD
ncbi:hypothetical protein AB0I54_37235 [Streptomyces sp. NPDC050625]|uniref:hypothetical protein n=1 Tax=Streptomyces sp. NPDC050625 TaxID=3154629 RepID=UPI0034163CF0